MIRSLSLALVFSLFLFSVAEAKVVAAPFSKVVQASEMGKAANKLLESKIGTEQKTIEKEIKSLQQQDQAFKKEVQEFQKQAAALSEKAVADKRKVFEKKAQDLSTKAQKIDEKRAAFAKKAAPMQQDIEKQMLEVLGVATKKLAESSDYSIIVDSNNPAVAFVAESSSIEEELLKEVNKAWKAQGSKFNL